MTELTIWKYVVPVNVLTVSATTVFHIPSSARFLHCREQHEGIAMWFLVNPDKERVDRKFQLFGTGHALPAMRDKVYYGTGIFDDGHLVLHLFEVFD